MKNHFTDSYLKTGETSKACPFQLNQAILYICRNKGYYRELYGNYLEYNCSWIESEEQESKLPEYIYMKTLYTWNEGNHFT